ncbi:hypothetical protein C900_01907 [Fulvivirga imtechensis AK7]|uniref:Uncharacterized protein n=1 Tax=Fulvivirga imtechensis AK7 TaxID=1237149 RepID=L8JXT9_9BACT|nr:hypothetical protein C900_01907 [Fulvivirga imtechensis AK7]
MVSVCIFSYSFMPTSLFPMVSSDFPSMPCFSVKQSYYFGIISLNFSI